MKKILTLIFLSFQLVAIAQNDDKLEVSMGDQLGDALKQVKTEE